MVHQDWQISQHWTKKRQNSWPQTCPCETSNASARSEDAIKGQKIGPEIFQWYSYHHPHHYFYLNKNPFLITHTICDFCSMTASCFLIPRGSPLLPWEIPEQPGKQQLLSHSQYLHGTCMTHTTHHMAMLAFIQIPLLALLTWSSVVSVNNFLCYEKHVFTNYICLLL